MQLSARSRKGRLGHHVHCFAPVDFRPKRSSLDQRPACTPFSMPPCVRPCTAAGTHAQRAGRQTPRKRGRSGHLFQTRFLKPARNATGRRSLLLHLFILYVPLHRNLSSSTMFLQDEYEYIGEPSIPHSRGAAHPFVSNDVQPDSSFESEFGSEMDSYEDTAMPPPLPYYHRHTESSGPAKLGLTRATSDQIFATQLSLRNSCGHHTSIRACQTCATLVWSTTGG